MSAHFNAEAVSRRISADLRASSAKDVLTGVPLVVVGLGNIGSHLVPHLARIRGGSAVVLIDRDTYEQKNLLSQNISHRDVGHPKARAHARRLRRLNPLLKVTAISAAVEDVPLGLLRGSIVLGCLDSRTSRRFLAAAAWHAGAIAYVDAGVAPDGLLVRVNVYVATPDAACLECAWDERDYAAQEQRYPCDEVPEGGAAVVPPTDAPSSLGALAAALQAIECRKLLEGEAERSLAGRQVVLDASWHRHYVTALQRNPRCRFDHRLWRIESLPARSTIADALALAGGEAALEVPGHAFVRRLACIGCGRDRRVLRLWSRLRRVQRTCGVCGKPMQAVGFDMTEPLRRDDVVGGSSKHCLDALGLVAGDIVSVSGPEMTRYFELSDGNGGGE
jgi:molybdopterin/thiamine biosynthesis adenylyltransferase